MFVVPVRHDLKVNNFDFLHDMHILCTYLACEKFRIVSNEMRPLFILLILSKLLQILYIVPLIFNCMWNSLVLIFKLFNSWHHFLLGSLVPLHYYYMYYLYMDATCDNMYFCLRFCRPQVLKITYSRKKFYIELRKTSVSL